jgi:hypothetical protein
VIVGAGIRLAAGFTADSSSRKTRFFQKTGFLELRANPTRNLKSGGLQTDGRQRDIPPLKASRYVGSKYDTER